MSTNDNTISATEGRVSAKNALKNQIESEKRRTQALEILMDEIHWDHLTKPQEDILWSYFIKQK